MVEVVGLDVRQHRGEHRELEVRAVALIGLDDEQVTPVHWAPVPASATSPPTRKLGASPPSARASISIDVVVVLPWVPATATERARPQIDASMPARRSVGMPSSMARRSSMLFAGTAVDDVTASQPST